jgi:hypothetical protein
MSLPEKLSVNSFLLLRHFDVKPPRTPLVGVDPLKRTCEGSDHGREDLGVLGTKLVVPIVRPPMMSKPEVIVRSPALISAS